MSRVGKGGLVPGRFGAGIDLMIDDDRAIRGEHEVVDEASRLLPVWSGVGERDFDELLSRLECVLNPLAVGIDSGQDFFSGEGCL